MGVSIDGMDEWIADLDTLPERAPKVFRGVMSRAGVQIKLDWKARWEAIRDARSHIPHLPRGIGYDTGESKGVYTVKVGVDPKNRQAFLAKVIEDGTLTSAPHPGGIPALNAEVPRMERAALKAAEDLLAER
jgi:hypothetical protein